MSDLALALEQRLVNAWPSFEVEMAEGWLLRFADGYSKRANSASPVLPGARLDADLVDQVEASFAARAIPVCFRLTGIEARGAAELLEARGYVDHDPSMTLVAPLHEGLALDPSIALTATPSGRWITAAAAAVGGDKSDHATLAKILARIRRPVAFATLALDGEHAAWGYAVHERGYVGIYDIVVASELRGLGLGRRLVSGLMSWGRDQGAERAYLQMREANEVAFGLYRSLGFDIAYRYRHRIVGEAR